MNIWDESPPSEPPDGSSASSPSGAESDAAADVAPAASAGAGHDGGDPPDPPEPPDASDDQDRPWWSQRIAGIPAWLLLALGGAIWMAVIAALVLPGGDDEPDDALVALPSTEVEAPGDTTGSTSQATTTTAPTTLPTISNAPTTPSTTGVTTTAAPTTTGATTTTVAGTTTTSPAATTTTTTPPTTTTTPPTTTMPATTTTTTMPAADDLEPVTAVGDDGRSITATPYRGPCSSGPDCLVVGFTIDEWATHPMGWVCEFSSGARYAFEFESGGADPACSTVDAPDSIVIDIDGLRTDPITIG